MLADTAPPHKDLRLQQHVTLTRFALHVIDGIFVLDVGIEAKNHAWDIANSVVENRAARNDYGSSNPDKNYGANEMKAPAGCE